MKSGRLKSGKPLARGKPLKRGKPLARGRSLTKGKRRSSGSTLRPRSAAEAVAATIFHDQVCAAGRCWLADNRSDHTCDGPLEAHHAIKKSAIWTEYRARLTERALLAIMYDPVIGIPICSGGHGLVEVRSVRIHFEELPAEMVTFCRDIGMIGRLMIDCPPKRERG